MDCTVVVAHVSSYPDPIRFSRGDRVAVGRSDDRYPGWIRVTIDSGNEGWAPQSVLRIEPSGAGVALEEYSAQELDTTVGESVRSLRELAGWLWVEDARGRQGWIPKASVRALPSV